LAAPQQELGSDVAGDDDSVRCGVQHPLGWFDSVDISNQYSKREGIFKPKPLHASIDSQSLNWLFTSVTQRETSPMPHVILE